MALALYRRYRPDTFDGVIGQDQVTVPLMRALDENKLTHAYLFSGPRGCGKTSSARILARCVNCAKGPTSHPCGECASCRDLATGGPGSIDVVEIDTLEKINAELIATLKETVQIQKEGKANREAAQVKMRQIESDLKNALLENAQQM